MQSRTFAETLHRKFYPDLYSIEYSLKQVLLERFVSINHNAKSFKNLDEIAESRWMEPLFHLKCSLIKHGSIRSTEVNKVQPLAAYKICSHYTMDISCLQNNPQGFFKSFPNTRIDLDSEVNCAKRVFKALARLERLQPELHSFILDNIRLILCTTIIAPPARYSFSLRKLAFGLAFIDSSIMSEEEIILLLTHEAIHQYIWMIWDFQKIEPFHSNTRLTSTFSKRKILTQVCFQSILIQLELMKIYKRLSFHSTPLVDCMHSSLKNSEKQIDLMSNSLNQLVDCKFTSEYELFSLEFIRDALEKAKALIKAT